MGLYEQKFYLKVRFAASGTKMILCTGTHEECINCAKIFIKFTMQEHYENKTGRIFNATMQGTDRIVVTSSKTVGKFNKPGLWATFEIEEVKNGQEKI